jgi:CheY-like chemotaxis protein
MDAKGSPSSETPATQRWPTFLIFHVDDDADDQALFQAACVQAQLPFSWHMADSARKAIGYFESMLALRERDNVRWPDLVVLDIVMPDGSGLKVLEFIRSQARIKNLPVLVFTGSPDLKLCEEARTQGATEVVHKPVDVADTVKLVGSLYAIYGGRLSRAAGN